MSDRTFEELWRKVLVYSPGCPIPLAQEFVNSAYSRALGSYPWAGLRKNSEFQIPAAYTTGTVAVTQNSTTITGTGTTWTSAMVGRQFFLSGDTYYTVSAFVSTTSLTLDRVYGGATATGQTYTIQLTYLTVPSDFLSFLSVVDLDQNWRLWVDKFTQEHLDRWDAERTSTGSPWTLVPASFSSSGLPRYELWPRPSAAKTLAFTYVKKPSLLSANSDKAIFPIRGNVLLHGALAELSLWPGLVKEEPNLTSSSDRYRAYEERFVKGLAGLELEDQQIAQTRIAYEDDSIPMAPIDAQFFQTHGLSL